MRTGFHRIRGITTSPQAGERGPRLSFAERSAVCVRCAGSAAGGLAGPVCGLSAPLRRDVHTPLQP